MISRQRAGHVFGAGNSTRPYELVALIGAGGMGEVYRARDTRLDRIVAVKVLASAFTSDEALRARFGREARAIAALGHPHICTLHDVGDQNGQVFLVMEYLDGKTLAERLKDGRLPLAQALEIGTQIAEALAAAHRQGIVHRDLKPGNVILTKSGAKLLDFGLARLAHHGERPAIDDLASAATESAPLTGRGTIVGTLPYMAPEQVEGKAADPRTDVWALGAVLYEMVTGRRAFEAGSSASLVATILEREPAPLATLQPLTPPTLERLVRRCLAKSPDDRWDGAHDVADELRWIGQAAPIPPATGSSAPRWRRPLIIGGLGLAMVSVLALPSRRLLSPSPSPPMVVRSLLSIGPAEEINAGAFVTGPPQTPAGSHTALAWTPDGREVVFVGRRGGVQKIYVRPLDGEKSRPLEGTEGAMTLAISANGRSVAFWKRDETVHRVPLSGGPVTLFGSIGGVPSRMAWGEDGRLFCDGPDDVIWSLEAERAPSRLTKLLDGEYAHVLPHALPVGRALLYTVRHANRTWSHEEVVAHVFATGERKVLLRDAADARFVAPGLLVFLRRGTLWAADFDPSRVEVRGDAVPVLDGVAQALTAEVGADITGAGQFSVASTGALAFVHGAVVPYPDANLVAVDRQGQVRRLNAPTRSYAPSLAISPDGRRLAVLTRALADKPIWIYDLGRGTLDKLSGTGEPGSTRWTPNGERVVFDGLDHGVYLAWQRADGTGSAETLARYHGPLTEVTTPFGDRALAPSSWSPDGSHLALYKDQDIWIATVANDRATLEPLTQTAAVEQWPEFSPDGRWLAYGSNDSGRNEVYVQPYPGPGPRLQVSLEGGTSPAWNPAGRELFFLSVPDTEGNVQMMVTDIRTAPTLDAGRPRSIFTFSPRTLRLSCIPTRCYAVAPDGRLFYGVQVLPASPPPPVTQIQLVQNWTEEVRARLRTAAER